MPLPSNYNAPVAIAQLPVGTKFIATNLLESYERGGYAVVYETMPNGQFGRTNNSDSSQRIQAIDRHWRYTVVESASGEIFYARGVDPFAIAS